MFTDSPPPQKTPNYGVRSRLLMQQQQQGLFLWLLIVCSLRAAKSILFPHLVPFPF